MLGVENITVTRKTGSWVRGKWVEVAPVPFIIAGSVQPLTSSQMQNLPEGRRNSTGFNLFVIGNVELTSAEVDEKNPDIVTIDAVNYEVVKKLGYRAVIAHNQYLVLKAGQ